MAFSTSGANGGRPGMMSEINVTPMVDVMLVLLIIFMVAAPMMTQGLDVELPKVDSTVPMDPQEKQTVLTIKPDGTVFLDEFEVSTTDLGHQVNQVMQAKGSKTVFLKADQATAYGDVAVVMGQLRAAGITSIGLVTDPADKSSGPPPLGQRPVKSTGGASVPGPGAKAPAGPPAGPVRSVAPGN